MRTILSLFIAIMAVCTVNAQEVNYKDIYAKQAKLEKLTREARSKKVSKDANKMAKRMEKDGWMPMPGKLPIARQLDRVYNMQNEIDEQERDKYIYGIGTSVANTTGAAHIVSLAAAREQIAGSMGTSVTSLIDNSMKNQQISTAEAATLHEAADRSKQIFSQNLGQTKPVLEVYRTLPNGNAEVQVGTMYSTAEVMRVIRETVKKELNGAVEDVDSKLGW